MSFYNNISNISGALEKLINERNTQQQRIAGWGISWSIEKCIGDIYDVHLRGLKYLKDIVYKITESQIYEIYDLISSNESLYLDNCAYSLEIKNINTGRIVKIIHTII